jgi:zinc transport system permease protein
MIKEALSREWGQNMLIVGLLTAVTASLVGAPLVLKRRSFLSDGLSHVAFGGLAVAAVINLTNNMLIIMPLTVLTSVLLLAGGERMKIKGDAAIAMVSVGALAFGYFLINTFSAQGNVAGDVCTSLFGAISIMTLTAADLWVCVGTSAAVIILYVIFHNKIFAVTFDSGFFKATGGRSKAYEIMLAVMTGVVVSLSMRFVGSLLTSALIVFPALSAMRVFKTFKPVVVSSAISSVCCAALGILTSIQFSTPTGATVVLINILAFAVFAVAGLAFKKKPA